MRGREGGEALRRAAVRQEALRQASDLLGGPSALIRAFTVESSELERWLRGKADVPAWVYLRAIEILHQEQPASGQQEPD